MCGTCGCGGRDVLISGKRPVRAGGALAFRTPKKTEIVSSEAAVSDDAVQIRVIQVERDLLAKNDEQAELNRNLLNSNGIFSLNLVSSPGSGKTTLLVKTIAALGGELPLAVIEGDQQTENDAERIRAAGAPAIQINTGKGCHLDAQMVGQAMQQLDLKEDSLLLIENVGNLVCPASFDLGEAHKVVILSVTEGEDKPLKYPDMFRAADLMLLNKCDLLPYLEFDAELAIRCAQRVNPEIRVIRLSAKSGEGMDEWLDWVRDGCRHAVTQCAAESAIEPGLFISPLPVPSPS